MGHALATGVAVGRPVDCVLRRCRDWSGVGVAPRGVDLAASSSNVVGARSSGARHNFRRLTQLKTGRDMVILRSGNREVEDSRFRARKLFYVKLALAAEVNYFFAG